MQSAFDITLDQYLYFGGYPGTARLIPSEMRWREFVRNALIRPIIDRDVLQTTRVDKPAVLKALFELGCVYSGQEFSYTKMLGQLQDAGNSTTLAHYLDLLSRAQLLTGLSKFAGQEHRKRASSPKWAAYNNALVSAQGNHTFDQARNDRTHWGRMVESTIGAHLLNTATEECTVFYWREGNDEVDFVLAKGPRLAAIEVKSGPTFRSPRGLKKFVEHYPEARALIVGEGGIPIAEFLSHPADKWLE